MNQKPVIMLLPYESCSGLELFGLRFAGDLQARGYPVKIAAPAGSLLDKQCQARGLELWPVPATVKYDLSIYPACFKMFRQLEPSAVVAFRTQMMYPMFFARLFSSAETRQFLFYRIGVGNHWRKDPIHRILFRGLSAVVPNADYVAGKIRKFWGIDHEKVVCIKSGVDVVRYRQDGERRSNLRQSLGIGENDLVIGSSGRIHPDKGSEILLRALFDENGPGRSRSDVHLLYVGREYQPGYADHLKKVASELGVEKRFHLLEFRNDVETVYSALDLFAFAVTSREAYAYVVLEAMASGVVPVVPATGGMTEMYEDGVEGFFFEHNNRDSLRACLKKAVELPRQTIQKMGNASRTRIVEHAEWGQMMEKYLALFHKCGVAGF